MRRQPLFHALALCLLAPMAQAATIVIVNQDGPGEGFNDPTPVLPVGGNAGATLGQQRLNVFQAAAAQWAAVLDSDVEIRVQAAFNPLTCSGTSAVLGSAGATQIFRDFPAAPEAGTWFSPAETGALTASDPDGAANDINSQFNSAIDSNPACLNGTTGWWYGLELSDDIPADEIPLMPVVFHELAHGLGFQTYTSGSTGAFASGFPSIFDHFLTDANLAGGTAWKDMTQVQRQASAVDDPFLVWSGDNVNARARGHLDPKPAAIVHAPASIGGNYDVQTASFGPPAPLSGLRALVVEGVDGTLPAFDACEPLTNSGDVAGKIVLVDRGLCNFTVKVAHAQAAGAIGVLVANNVPAGLPSMGGADPAVTISSYGITQALGNAIRAALVSDAVDATLGYDLSVLAGMTDGMTRMYGPSPFVSGSSVSHFSTANAPNLLMEPSLNESLFSETDLTVPLFRDIHWPIIDAAIQNVAPRVDAAAVFDAIVDVPTPLTEIVIGDVDAGDGSITVAFEVDSGTMSLEPAAGVTTSGNNSATASISGARAVLLPYIVTGNVRFTTANGNMNDVGLLITINDNGNTGTGGALTDDAVATIEIQPNQPPLFSGPIAAQANEENDVVSLDVSGFFSDVDTPLTFSTTSGLPPGITLSEAGVFSGHLDFDSAGSYPGIVVSANDGATTVDSNAFVWTVDNVNRAPVAGTQTLDTAFETALDVTLAATDEDDDALTFGIVSGPDNGVLDGTPPDLTYTPDAGFAGTDSFTFTADDGTDVSAPATVEITVGADPNQAPVATPQSVSTTAGVALGITLAGSDADNDALDYSVQTQPANGVLSGTAPDLVYTPNDGFEGSDSFTFIVNDGSLDSAPATVDITVDPALNSAPVFDDEPYAFGVLVTVSDGAAVGAVSATDADDDVLGYTITAGNTDDVFAIDPATGAITVANAATLGAAGTGHVLTVTVSDGQGGSDETTVTVEVLGLDLFEDGFEG